MLAIDCNVLVHLLLEGEHTEQARELLPVTPIGAAKHSY